MLSNNYEKREREKERKEKKEQVRETFSFTVQPLKLRFCENFWSSLFYKNFSLHIEVTFFSSY